jgi:hypothetical protein
LLLHKRFNHTQYVYRATKLEAFIYHLFFTMKIVTGGEEEGGRGRGNEPGKVFAQYDTLIYLCRVRFCAGLLSC